MLTVSGSGAAVLVMITAVEDLRQVGDEADQRRQQRAPAGPSSVQSVATIGSPVGYERPLAKPQAA